MPRYRPIHTRPTAEQARAKFDYNPDTGQLYSKVTHRNVGHHYGKCYLGVWLEGTSWPAHRVAWLITYGEWPDEQIDHINGDGRDNRLHNLRQATATQNLRNRGCFKNNKLGVKGVCQIGPDNYRAQLWKDGKFILAKQGFKTAAEASAAYEAAALEAFGAFHRKSAPIAA